MIDLNFRIAAWSVSVFAMTVLVGVVLNERFSVQPYSCDSYNDVDAIQFQNANDFLDAFLLPDGWTVLSADERSSGWRQTGFAPVPPLEAERELDAAMARYGCVARHRVGNGCGLVQYENEAGLKTLWSLSPASKGRTMFSWGISK